MSSPAVEPRFQIETLLGVGGMGQVYRAVDTRLGRPVALKMLRGRDEESEDRMLREARAQARVEHPNVCRVFEVGKLDGKPFVAMQLVDGLPLDEAASDLDRPDLLLVMRRVAEAVQAAHGTGLVHRDLKPANVLVETRGGTPEPYVLDFGLAVELDAPGLTTTGIVRGTPGYMAPEQIAGDRDRIDRRTDVYALGAILYRLLAGRAPFEGDTPIEVLVQATSSDPPPLRSVAPDVPRDLALIVHKCLERDPDLRYPSARLLAEDLDRLLAGEPVLAQPPSWTYRVARAIHRHRGRAAAAAGVTLLLLAGGLKYGWDLRQERAVAVAAREEAEEVSAFLVELLQGVDPAQARGREVPVRELVDRAAGRIGTDLAARPAARARVMEVLGSLYLRLGDLARAEELLDGALALREEPGARASSLEALGDLRYWQGEYEQAQRLYAEALALHEAVGDDPFARSAAMHGLAKARIEVGALDDARRVLEQVVAIRRARPDRPRALATALGELGRAELEAGAFDPAEEHLRESLALLERYGRDEPLRIDALDALGQVYHERGQLRRAAAVFEESVGIESRLLGRDHQKVAVGLSNLARTLRMAGDYDRAEALYREVLEIYDGAVGADYQGVGITWSNLGKLYRDVGRFAEARTALDRALGILREAVGEEASRTAVATFNLGQLEMDLGRLEEAEALFRRALAAFRTNGERHPYVGIGLEGLGDLELRAGRAAAAVATLREALSIQEEAFGPDGTRTARCRARLAAALVAAGDPDAARDLAERSIASMERHLRDRPEELQAARSLALALHARGAAREALGQDPTPSYRRLVAILESRPEVPEVTELAALLADGLRHVGRAGNASTLEREVARTGMSVEWLDAIAPGA